MKYLFKVTTIQVNGYDGEEVEHYNYVVSEYETLVDDAPIEWEDVVEADKVFLEYNKYENLGFILDEEINVLMKFNIINI
jgi:hypothetical protein